MTNNLFSWEYAHIHTNIGIYALFIWFGIQVWTSVSPTSDSFSEVRGTYSRSRAVQEKLHCLWWIYKKVLGFLRLPVAVRVCVLFQIELKGNSPGWEFWSLQSQLLNYWRGQQIGKNIKKSFKITHNSTCANRAAAKHFRTYLEAAGSLAKGAIHIY